MQATYIPGNGRPAAMATAAGERVAWVLGDAHPGSSKATPRSAHT
jgi:hypothetical protein